MTTTVVKTIGTGGGFDYSTVQTWEDGAPANLVTADQVWKGVIQSKTYNEVLGAGVTFTISGSTTDATRYKWLTVLAGSSFCDNLSAGPLRLDSTQGATLTDSNTAYTAFLQMGEGYSLIERLQLVHQRSTGITGGSSVGVSISKCLMNSIGGGAAIADVGMSNCLVIKKNDVNAVTIGLGGMVNCTVVVPSGVTYSSQLLSRIAYSGTPPITNCALFAAGQAAFNTSFVYSNCFTDRAAPPTGCTNVSYDTSTGSGFQNITDGSEDFRIKSASALKDAGTSSGAPLVDIVGTSRPQGAAYDVGVWEFVATGSASNPALRAFPMSILQH